MRYTPRTTADPHQEEALRRIASRPRAPSREDVFALLMEMGTGKTKVVLDEFQARVGEDINNLFVIAPAGSYWNWFEDKGEDDPSEIRRHLDPALYRDLAVAAWVPGAAAEKKRVDVIKGRAPRALFMNVEALSTGTRALDYARKFLATGRTTLVIDEATVIRNDGAKRTKRVLELGERAYARRILTGLITPRSPLDLYWQMCFLDWRILGHPSFVNFRARYAEVEKICYLPRSVIEARLRSRYRGEAPLEALTREELIAACEKHRVYIPMATKVKGMKNLGELQKKIAPYCYRVLKSDVLNLPPKIYGLNGSWGPLYVELTADQARMYEELKKRATTEISSSGTYVTVQAAAQLLLRYQQIVCGHVGDEEGNIQDVASNRINVLCDVLANHEGKAVIWVPFVREFDKVVARLRADYGAGAVAKYCGANAATRREEEAEFSTNSDCRFMVSTSAGVRGNNWQCADLVVYYANWWDLEMRAQSEDRTHRRGQGRAVTYVDLAARGTVDEKIIWALRNKIDLAAAVMGDKWREWLV
jgi:SNF2-related domain/Helicase conserved C-terminal domain